MQCGVWLQIRFFLKKTREGGWRILSLGVDIEKKSKKKGGHIKWI